MEKIIMIVFLLMNTVSICYSYDLSTLDSLKQCKADSNCYACEVNGAVSQCVKLSPYDKELGEINSNKYDWVCNASSKKEICNKSENKKEITKKYHVVDKYVINITDGQSYQRYNSTTISLSNYTVVEVYQYASSVALGYGLGDNHYKVDYKKLIQKELDNGWTINRSYISDEDLYIILEKDIYNYTCPSDNNKSCYKDGNNYFCSLSECSSGSGIQLETNDPNMSPDDLVDTSKNINKEKQICSVDSVTIAEGTFGSCRRPSTLVDKDLTNDCCEMTIDNRDAQDAIVTGIADVISVLGGTYTLISDLLKEIGLADFDFINQLLVDVINMMRGGRCTDSEMMIATSAASTRGLVVKDSGGEIVYKDKNDGGNCVYLGEYCTNYAGHCDKGSFLGIKWENPIGWGCERPAKAFCCYSDIFEKALAKAARDQMPNKYNWGSINGDVVSPTRLYSPGKNPCKPDKDKLKVNCDGVALSDLVNINFDSEQFQEDMIAYTGILLNDITKPGGAIDMANEELRNNIKNLNPADILQDTLNSIGAIK